MRKEDHQIISEYFVGTFKKGVKYDAEGTGLGWATVGDHPRQGHRPAQHLQDEASERLLTNTTVACFLDRGAGVALCGGQVAWKSLSSRF